MSLSLRRACLLSVRYCQIIPGAYAEDLCPGVKASVRVSLVNASCSAVGHGSCNSGPGHETTSPDICASCLKHAGSAPGTLLNCSAQYTSTKLLPCLGPSCKSNLSYVLAILVIVTAIIHLWMRDIHSATICWMYILSEARNTNKETVVEAD